VDSGSDLPTGYSLGPQDPSGKFVITIVCKIMLVTNRRDKPYSGVRLNYKDMYPLAAMTCESTQPTLIATTQYGTFVLAVVQLFAAYNCRKRSMMIK